MGMEGFPAPQPAKQENTEDDKVEGIQLLREHEEKLSQIENDISSIKNMEAGSREQYDAIFQLRQEASEGVLASDSLASLKAMKNGGEIPSDDFDSLENRKSLMNEKIMDAWWLVKSQYENRGNQAE